MTKMLWKI